jgi:hypothetical protein
VCGSTAESTLLRPVGTIRIFPILEIEADLIEAFLGYKVILLAEVATIYDRINKLSWIRFEVAAALNTANALEAERIPYPA